MKTAVVLLALLLLSFGAEPTEAIECGVANRTNCDQECAGRKVNGCKSCGFLCQACDCGDPITVAPVKKKMVCCRTGPGNPGCSSILAQKEWVSEQSCAQVGSGKCPDSDCGH